jgi:hypothetical protein
MSHYSAIAALFGKSESFGEARGPVAIATSRKDYADVTPML